MTSDPWDILFPCVSPGDMQSLRIDALGQTEEMPSIDSLTSTAEEMKLLTIDESLSDINRACFMLSQNNSVQIMSAMKIFPFLVRDFKSQAIEKVLPKIKENLSIANSKDEWHIATSYAFTQIDEAGSLKSETFAENLLGIMLTYIDAEDKISEVWASCLIKCLPRLPKLSVKKYLYPLLMEKSSSTQNASKCITRVQLLALVALHLREDSVTNAILPIFFTLCKDISFNVRVIVTKELSNFAKIIDQSSLNMERLLAEFEELMLQDEEFSVRGASLSTLIDLTEILHQEDVKKKLVPLLFKFIGEIKHEDSANVAHVDLLHLFGKILHSFKSICDQNERTELFNNYLSLTDKSIAYQSSILKTNKLSTIPEVEIIKVSGALIECAYNFPAVLLYSNSDQFVNCLLPIMTEFCGNFSVSIKKIMSSCFHELCKILSERDQIHLIKSQFLTLLKEDSQIVISPICQHLYSILIAFNSSKVEPNICQVFISSLTQLLAKVAKFTNWRPHKATLSSFSILPTCISNDLVYTKFSNNIFRSAYSPNVRPVQLEALKTLTILLRHNQKYEQRLEIINKLHVDFAKSKKYTYRALYIDLVLFVIDNFSKKFVIDHFFVKVLDLHLDPVSNVRLKLCTHLPKFKKIILLLVDKKMEKEFDEVVRNLFTKDNNVDVQNAVKNALREINAEDIRIEALLRSGKKYKEEDMIDQEREKEEEKIFALYQADAEAKNKRTKKRPPNLKIPSNTLKSGKQNRENSKDSSSLARNSLSGIFKHGSFDASSVPNSPVAVKNRLASGSLTSFSNGKAERYASVYEMEELTRTSSIEVLTSSIENLDTLDDILNGNGINSRISKNIVKKPQNQKSANFIRSSQLHKTSSKASFSASKINRVESSHK